MLGQSNHKPVVVNIKLRMKVVIDIPKPAPKLIKCPVGTGDHKSALIGEWHPAVVGNHVVVVAGVSMQRNDQRRVGLNVLGNMNAILPVQSIVLKRNVLAKSTHGQKTDDGNQNLHGFNITHLSNHTTEIISNGQKKEVPSVMPDWLKAEGPCLRATFGDMLIKKGVSIPAVARLMRHKDGGGLLLKKYTQGFEEEGLTITM